MEPRQLPVKNGYTSPMTLNRILLIVAVVCLLITALSAFSDDVNVNETGFLALGLASYVGSYLGDGAIGVGRGRAVAGRRSTWRDGPVA